MALSRPVVRRDFCWTLSLHTRFFAPERTRDERWREESCAQEAEVRVVERGRGGPSAPPDISPSRSLFARASLSQA